MRFAVYSLMGIVSGGLIGAAGGFLGWLEYVRFRKVDGVAVALGAAYFGFYLMLILGTFGAAIGVWCAWLQRKQNRSAATS